MFAGDWAAAHKEACAFVDQVYGVPIEKKADIVIASCGGWPKDINVYQMQKTMDNAVLAVREGGCVVLLAECEEGSGSKVLEETCRRLKSPDAIEADLAKRFVIGEHKAYAITRLMKKAHFILVTGLDRTLAKDLFFTAAVDSPAEAMQIAEGIVGADSTVALMPTGSLTVPLYRG
ncbi:MAG: transcriptional regulator, partial [Pyramidobacter sp.]|nr:transcriptional regulator [Pyramidobacter sp.]